MSETPTNKLVHGVSPAVIGTILLIMMFFKDSIVATACQTIAKLCGWTPDAREPYPANDLSAKDDSWGITNIFVSMHVTTLGFFTFFIVYAESKRATRTSMRSMQKCLPALPGRRRPTGSAPNVRSALETWSTGPL